MNIQIPVYIKHMTDVELRDQLDEHMDVLGDCVEYAQGVAKNEKAEPTGLHGLWFAYLHYIQLVAEMERRFMESSPKLENPKEQ